MRVAILHHDLEFAEKKIAEVFKEKGHDSYLIDVRSAKPSDFENTDLVLNRVYASVANRDYQSIKKTLELLKELEEKGIECLNSYRTSVFDYDKYLSSVAMTEAGIQNPQTILIDENKDTKETAEYLVKELGFPIIIKRNIGGRGKDVSRVSTAEEIVINLEDKFMTSKEEGYLGGFIAQEFAKTNRDHDCRLGVINGDVVFSYSRSLIASNSEDKWLASTSNGSTEGIYEAEDIEKKMGIKASNSIGAQFNELDIMFTDEGPTIIENNPTPNYFDEIDDHKRIEQFVYVILNKFNTKNL